MTEVETFFKQPKSEKKPRKGVKAQRGGTAASLKRKATVLHSQYVRARAGVCERCGRSDGQLQCAHIVSRMYAATRTDENNAWCLCAACHRYLTQHPDVHVWFAFETRGEDGYRALREKAYAGSGKTMKVEFWRDEVARLSKLMEAL